MKSSRAESRNLQRNTFTVFVSQWGFNLGARGELRMQVVIMVLPWQPARAKQSPRLALFPHDATCCLRGKQQKVDFGGVSLLTLYVLLGMCQAAITPRRKVMWRAMSQPALSGSPTLQHSEREREGGLSVKVRNTSGFQDSRSTYNAALGLGLNIQFQDSIAWGEREFGKFKTSAQSGREAANQVGCYSDKANGMFYNARSNTWTTFNIIINALRVIRVCEVTVALAEDVFGRFPQIWVCRRDSHRAWWKTPAC